MHKQLNNIIAEDGLLYSTDRWLWDHIKSSDKMEIGMITRRIDPEIVVYVTLNVPVFGIQDDWSRL